MRTENYKIKLAVPCMKCSVQASVLAFCLLPPTPPCVSHSDRLTLACPLHSLLYS